MRHAVDDHRLPRGSRDWLRNEVRLRYPRHYLDQGLLIMSEDLFALLSAAQRRLDLGFADLPPTASPALGTDAAAILNEAATRLHDNYPYAHPLYAGQMLKPPHPIARAAYALTMSVNPNNHALDGGRASSAMELEAVHELAKMFGIAAGD